MSYFLFMYLWVSVGVFLLAKLLLNNEGLKLYQYLLLAVLSPFIILDAVISKLLFTLKGFDKMSILNNTRKLLSNMVDRLAIRTVNVCDMVRGSYEK